MNFQLYIFQLFPFTSVINKRDTFWDYKIICTLTFDTKEKCLLVVLCGCHTTPCVSIEDKNLSIVFLFFSNHKMNWLRLAWKIKAPKSPHVVFRRTYKIFSPLLNSQSRNENFVAWVLPQIDLTWTSVCCWGWEVNFWKVRIFGLCFLLLLLLLNILIFCSNISS